MCKLLKHSLSFVAVAVLTVCTVRADEWDKRTVVTINQPIEIPNQVLEPGTYVFKLANSQSDRHIVQIFNKDETHLIATILAVPDYRLQPTGKTQITFWEREAGSPSALRAWFYPGDNFGQEFAYPPRQAAEIASYSHQPVTTTTAKKSEEYANATVTQTQPPQPAPSANPAPAPAQTAPANPLAQAQAKTAPPPPPPSAETQTQQQPAPAPAPQTQPAPRPAPSELPHTASNTPLIGLIGLLSLLGAAVAFLVPARSR